MAGRFGRFSGHDAIAGVVTAVTNIPDAMANATLVGVSPVHGLYALLVGTPTAALTTGSSHLVVAVTAAMALVVGDVLVGIPGPARLGAVVALTVLVGVVNTVLGLAKGDTLLRFVSNAVTRGFLTGAALSIALNQVPEFFGTSSDAPGKLGRAVDVLLHPARAELHVLAVGAGTLALILLLERTRVPRIASPIALVAVTSFVRFAGWDVHAVGDIAAIPRSLPSLVLPSFDMIPQMVLPAVAVAAIGLIQAAGISKTTPEPDGSYPVLSRDFIGQGIANVASGFVGGVPVGGSVSSTSLSLQAGARTRWAGFVIGPIVAVVLLALAPLIEMVPMASLAAVLILVGIRAVDIPRIRAVWQASWTSGFVMASTFVATLVMPIHFAVLLGAVLSVMQYVYSSSLDVKVVRLDRDETGRFKESSSPERLASTQVTLLDIYGSIFYAGADVIERALPETTDAERPVVILRLRGRVDVGSTFLSVLRRYNAAVRAAGGKLMLGGVGPELYGQLERTGLAAELGSENIFRATPYVTESLDSAVREAESWLEASSHNGRERTP